MTLAERDSPFDFEGSLRSMAEAASRPLRPAPPLDELALRREQRRLAPYVAEVARLQALEAAAVVKLRGHVAAVEFFAKDDGRLTPVGRENFEAARAASDLIESTRAEIERARAAALAAVARVTSGRRTV